MKEYFKLELRNRFSISKIMDDENDINEKWNNTKDYLTSVASDTLG